MATVTKTIGTVGRDYSTITSWEADLDNDTPYDAADDAVGEVYNDSVFDEHVVWNGGATLGLASAKLIVPESEIHDGTEGNGARIVSTATTGGHMISMSGATPKTIEGLVISGPSGVWSAIHGQGGADIVLSRLLIHDVVSTSGANGDCMAVGHLSSAAGWDMTLLNSIIYNIEQQANSSGKYARGLYVTHGSSPLLAYNVTVVNVFTTTALAHAYGYDGRSASDIVTNVIAMDTSDGGAGDAADFKPDGATVSYSMSSDTSATGTGSLTSKASTDQFVSTVGGSEDFHLKTGADAIDAGTDLGTTPAGVEIDIDGRDRDAEGDTWDMGAHELVSLLPSSRLLRRVGI